MSKIIVVLLLSFAFKLHATEMMETDRVCANYPDSEQCVNLSEQARAFCKGQYGRSPLCEHALPAKCILQQVPKLVLLS
jgi:hypothetical protein